MVTPSSRSSASDVEQLVDHRRRQAERRLVEQQDARLCHQPARDRQHLLLAAGEKSGAAVSRSRSRGKRCSSASISASRSTSFAGMRAEHDVVAHAEFGKHLPALRHQRDAARGDTVRRPSARRAGRRARSRRCTGRSSPVTARIAVDLPAPLAPSSATISPRPHRERHLIEHRRGAVAGAELHAGQDRVLRTVPGDGARPRPHLAAAEIGLQHARIAPDFAPARRPRSTAPASSTTTWSEMPITSAMSCSTRMTAMPSVGDAPDQLAQRDLVGAHQAGRRLVEQQHARARRQRARDLDQPPIDMRQARSAGAASAP